MMTTAGSCNVFHKVPQYIRYEDRLASFAAWPPQISQNKTTLARCGLFYSNVSDHVNCFSCGVTLYGWKPEDNPWREHKRLSKNCIYLSMVGVDVDLDIPNHYQWIETTTSEDINQKKGDEWKPLTSNHTMCNATRNIWQKSPQVSWTKSQAVSISPVSDISMCSSISDLLQDATSVIQNAK